MAATAETAMAKAEGGAGRLDLNFAVDGDGRTFVGRQYAAYPYHVCRPHYLDPELPGMATLYTQSSAGGLYEGDRHRIAVSMDDGAQAHVTTQASTIVHRTESDEIVQEVHLMASNGACLEFIPDPAILFAGARFRSRLEVTVDDHATVVLGDAYIAHDPDGRGRCFDWLDSRTRVTASDGRPLVLDRFRVTGETWQCPTPGILGPYAAQATLMVLSRGVDQETLVAALRTALADREGLYAGVSRLPRACGAWARILVADGVLLKDAIIDGWVAARHALTGHHPPLRRK